MTDEEMNLAIENNPKYINNNINIITVDANGDVFGFCKEPIIGKYFQEWFARSAYDKKATFLFKVAPPEDFKKEIFDYN